MQRRSFHIRKWLLPLSWLYGLIVEVRNILFDYNILKGKLFNIPIICVGNITAGGTGKTPHVEYLVKLLSPKYKVAVLSRGYKRKSSGFLFVETDSLVSDVGDEPLQIKRKFPHILVAVDRKRKKGVEKLLKQDISLRPEVIILDDGFQHRYVTPSLSILLTDYNRPIYRDYLLPSGLLREPLNNKNRASVVVLTKCPTSLRPIDYRIAVRHMNLFPFQHLYFTSFRYGLLSPVFEEIGLPNLSLSDLKDVNVLTVTGIANPQPLIDKVNETSLSLSSLVFADHKDFVNSELKQIDDAFKLLPKENRLIITTEKDAMRLRKSNLINVELKKYLYFLPIEVFFLGSREQRVFDNKILDHVENYKRDSFLSEG